MGGDALPGIGGRAVAVSGVRLSFGAGEMHELCRYLLPVSLDDQSVCVYTNVLSVYLSLY